MPLLKRKFDESYHTVFWYRESENSQRNQARLDLLRGLLVRSSSPARLLEVGCGQGGFLRMAEAHFEVEGIDISPSAVRGLREHFGERVRSGNIEQQPLPRQRYAAIVAFNILEHLHYPEKAISRLYEALLPGGLLLGSVPNNQGLAGRPVTALTNLFDRTHVSTLNPETWRRIFNHAGFRQLDFFGEVTFGRNRCRYLRGRLWKQLSFNLMFVCHKAGPVE